ncbi:hypothetical protein [Sandarakinorhabdus sp.]|uniref:hypothetical protein n=1 Tax=Sandarakinorhabdus sp. TaxID=1916663 RepID=UPI003F70C0BE
MLCRTGDGGSRGRIGSRKGRVHIGGKSACWPGRWWFFGAAAENPAKLLKPRRLFLACGGIAGSSTGSACAGCRRQAIFGKLLACALARLWHYLLRIEASQTQVLVASGRGHMVGRVGQP